MLQAMIRSRREEKRTTFIAVLLAATFLLTAFLAIRAQFASQDHRATAEKVIRDWSALAGDEFARRSESYILFYGTYPILQAIESEPGAPDRERVESIVTTAEGRRNAKLVAHTFRVNLKTRQVTVSPGTPDDVRGWLIANIAEIVTTPASGDIKPVHAGVGGIDHTFVYALSDTRGSASGIDINLDALMPFFSLAMKMKPLLPASLAHGKVTNDSIFVRVADRLGRTLFHSPGAFDPTLGAVHRIEDGLLRGMTVETSIARHVAPLLVIGGVPRSPVLIYAGALALTAMLITTAVFQLRKERALARLRSDFVASVSHELRTPLAQIRMFAETLMLDRVRTDAERRRSLAVIDQETRRLATVVENVLQFSRGERGTLRIAPHPCDVVAVVRETIELFAPIAAARRVRIRFDADGQITANVDEGAIRQILLNLFDNAVKYGPLGQEVVVAVLRDASTVRISVDDEGAGIPASERRRVWNRYYRLDRDRVRAIAGAGIGLAVVQELVALHGGRASIEDGLRGGARMVVELPAKGES